MASLVTTELLTRLKSLYPLRSAANGIEAILSSPWYVVSAVAFSASNRPEAVPLVFQYALEDLKKAQTAQQQSTEKAHQERLKLARRTREALLKSGLLSGYSKAINGLIALHEVTPEELRETQTLRNPNTTMEEYTQLGEKVFRSMYGENTESVQGLLDSIYPDMGWFSTTVGYGITYGATDVLTQVEVSYVLVATLICADTPRQIGWHLANARNGGATSDQTKAIRQIAMEIGEKCGVRWREGVPEVE